MILTQVLENLDKKKYSVPENWPYQEARELFKNPNVTDPADVILKWTLADEEEVVKFLVIEKGFNEERVRKGIQKLNKSKQTSTQGRLDSFFKPKEKSEEEIAKSAKTAKRKVVSWFLIFRRTRKLL